MPLHTARCSHGNHGYGLAVPDSNSTVAEAVGAAKGIPEMAAKPAPMVTPELIAQGRALSLVRNVLPMAQPLALPATLWPTEE